MGEMIRRRLYLILPIMAICVILDQGTKALAQALLPPGTIHLLGDLVRLQLSENVGAFLSLGAGLPPAIRFLIFTVASALLVVAVFVYTTLDPHLPRDLIIALSCVAGGGLSNLIDRTTRNGRVLDFLNFGIGNLRTGILNVADIFITFGALYVIWVGIRGVRNDEQSEETDPEDSAGE
jgi:signal peptidase II